MSQNAYIEKKLLNNFLNKLTKEDYAIYILIEVLSKFNPSNPKTKISIDLAELKEFMDLGGNGAVSRLKYGVRRIASTPIEAEDDDVWVIGNLFENAIFAKRSAKITVSLNDLFLPYLTDLKQFAVLSRNVLKAKAKSIKFYTYLRKIHRYTPVNVDWLDLQAACDVSYIRFVDFRRNVLEPVIKDLTKAGIKISYQEISRNNILKLDFTIREEETMQEKLDKMPDDFGLLSSEDFKDKTDSVLRIEERKKRKPSQAPLIQEVYDYFNEELVRRYSPERRLRALNDKRKIAIRKMLEKGSVEECKQAIIGFFNARKDSGIEYLDLPYVDRYFEQYLGKAKLTQPKRKPTKEEINAELDRKMAEYQAAKVNDHIVEVNDMVTEDRDTILDMLGAF